MSRALKLKGNELMVYALIYSFSAHYSCFRLSDISYITKWFNISEKTARKAIESLKRKEYIEEITPNTFDIFPLEYYGVVRV